MLIFFVLVHTNIDAFSRQLVMTLPEALAAIAMMAAKGGPGTRLVCV